MPYEFDFSVVYHQIEIIPTECALYQSLYPDEFVDNVTVRHYSSLPLFIAHSLESWK